MLKIVLKFLFAAGIIYWLLKSGDLDFSLVKRLVENHLAYLVGCFAILFSVAATSAYRWKLLLEIKTEKKLPFFQVLKLNWVGLFFSSVLPGAVTGDIIKLVYAKSLSPKLSKTFLITSVLLDRIIGLQGLLLLMGFCTLFNYLDLVAISPQMEKVVRVNLLLLLGAFGVLAVLLLPKKYQYPFFRLLQKVPLIGQKLANTLDQVWLIGGSRKKLFQCLILSILLQGGNVFAFWLVASPFYDIPLGLQHAFSFIPIGLISIAIPISPAGLGVGHAVFNVLFAYYGISKGASLFNLYYISLVGVNILGFIPYVLYSKKAEGLKTTEEESVSLNDPNPQES